MINYILGQGLIGSNLNNFLIKSGEKTKVFSLESGWDLRVRPPSLEDNEIYCWFLAWDIGGSAYQNAKENQAVILYNNLALCMTVFPWLIKNKIPFTFISSPAVSAAIPSAYGTTKQVGEFWSGLSSNGLIARLWNIYGFRTEPRGYVIEDLISQGLKDKSIKLKTDGKERRQLVHVRDCVEALLQQRRIQQKVADIASGKWITIRKIAEIISKELRVPLIIGPQTGSENMREPRILLKGWEPKIKLVEGLREIIQSYRTIPK